MSESIKKTQPSHYTPVEGVEILYDASKSFWKTRVNLEIIIAHHIKLSIYEIIAFHPELGKESTRLYLNSVILSKKIDQKDVQQIISDKKEDLLRQKKNVNLPLLTKEVLNNCIVQYLLQRINYSYDNEEKDSFHIEINPLTGDSQAQDGKVDYLCTSTASLKPLEIHFTKKVQHNEVNALLHDLQNSAKELKKATRLAELATSSVDGFKLMLAEKIKIENELKRKYSPARLKWIRAINRVLIQNYVEKVKIRLGISADPQLQSVSLDQAEAQNEHEVIVDKKMNSKFSRRSFSGFLTEKHENFPAINRPSQLNLLHHNGLHHSNSALNEHLPSLNSPMNNSDGLSSSRKRNRALVTRRSFHNEMLPPNPKTTITSPTHAEKITHLEPLHHQPLSPTIDKQLSFSSDKLAVPTLLESYHHISQQPVRSIPNSALSSEISGRMMRLSFSK